MIAEQHKRAGKLYGKYLMKWLQAQALSTLNHGNTRKEHGTAKSFTLIEIMIVVGIIGLLAVIVVPLVLSAWERTQNTRFVNDLRIAVNAFEQYNIETGLYPPDRTPAVMPPNMSDYLTKMKWTENTVIGGQWDWDYMQFSCTAGVSVYSPNASDDRMTDIDKIMDDGDLSSGIFRKRTDGFISIIE